MSVEGAVSAAANWTDGLAAIAEGTVSEKSPGNFPTSSLKPGVIRCIVSPDSSTAIGPTRKC